MVLSFKPVKNLAKIGKKGEASSRNLFFALLAATIAFVVVVAAAGQQQPRPNFVLVMCDDLDLQLGGVGSIPQVKRLLGEGGATASNYFVSSPKCTPSRSAWLTGRHYHNLRPNGARTGRGLNTSSFRDVDAVFPMLRAHGYTTGIFGKIHNDQGRWLCKPGNDTTPFDHIETECSPCGGYYRTGTDNWVVKDTHKDVPQLMTLDPKSPFSNYSEAQYGNRTIKWIERLVEQRQEPFFAFIGTSGPHLPVVPAPWHRRRAAELTLQAPRTPNFNMHAADHHPLLATAPPFDKEAIEFLDRHMQDRWATLFSIDDMVAVIIKTIEALGISDHTYILFTSDHGYHLGQFRIPDEKMMPYETDIRVPFFARGPGIKAGTALDQLVSNIDIAPTLLDLAGVSVPNIMDGRSMAPLLHGGTQPDLRTAHLQARPWRTHFMTEFAEGGWQEWGTNSMWATDPSNPTVDFSVTPPWGPNCTKRGNCPANPCPLPENCPTQMRNDYAYDDPSYQWRALRIINATHDVMFAQWDPLYEFGVPPPPPPPPAPPIKPATLMHATDIVGPNEPDPCPAAPYGNVPVQCAQACQLHKGCLGWVLHFNPLSNHRAPGWRCCAKTQIQGLKHAPSTTTSGILHPSSSLSSSPIPSLAKKVVVMTKEKMSPLKPVATFSEFYNIKTDPWQMKNLWAEMSTSEQERYEAEIAHRFACHGTRDTPSNCE